MKRSVVAVALVATVSCLDSTSPHQGALENRVGVIVSGLFPMRGQSTTPAASTSIAPAGVAYVSLPPSTVQDGIAATVTNHTTGVVLMIAMLNGGFDPVAIGASVGDTLAVDITTRSSDKVPGAFLVVAARRRPRVVRTVPPSGGRDVPLNTTIVVVFSEPIDSTTLDPGIALRTGDSVPVSGRTGFADTAQLKAAFQPTDQLAPNTSYQLVVTQAIRDLNGIALDSAAVVTFTTGTAPTGPGAGSLAGDVFAVGSEGAVGSVGAILHYDGTRWTSQDIGRRSQLFGVWGTSGNDVFAVGDYGTILHYDGTSWTAQASGTTYGIHGVWGTSRNDVFAVGDYGTILHYDGTSWTQQMRDTTLFFAGVWGSSGSDVFAVADYENPPNVHLGHRILHYDGTSWTIQTTIDSPIELYGVWGTSGHDVFAVGDAILHYDGTSWTGQGSWFLFDVWGSSGNDVFAVGDGSIVHYDGASWTPMQCPCREDGSINGVWGSSGSNVFAVGIGGSIKHYDGSRWTTQTTGLTPTFTGILWAVWGSSPPK